MSFYTDEERTRCNEQGCNNTGVPPDYTICMQHYEEMMNKSMIDFGTGESQKDPIKTERV